MNRSDQRELDRAIQALMKMDPNLKDAVKAFGFPASRRSPAGFTTLARIVVDQQISTHAAASIWAKLKLNVGRINAPNLSSAPPRVLKASGLSAAKIKTLKVLAGAVESGDLSFRSLHRCTDDDVRSRLTAFWGIGDWTADIYLMFGMGRPDVWPAGDLALRTAWQTITQDRKRIDKDKLNKLASAWKPHRSAAAVLLWHSLKASR